METEKASRLGEVGIIIVPFADWDSLQREHLASGLGADGGRELGREVRQGRRPSEKQPDDHRFALTGAIDKPIGTIGHVHAGQRDDAGGGRE